VLADTAPYELRYFCFFCHTFSICDRRDLEEECLDSSTTTEGGNASAVFYPGGDYEQEVPVVGKLTEKVTQRVVRYFSLVL